MPAYDRGSYDRSRGVSLADFAVSAALALVAVLPSAAFGAILTCSEQSLGVQPVILEVSAGPLVEARLRTAISAMSPIEETTVVSRDVVRVTLRYDSHGFLPTPARVCPVMLPPLGRGQYRLEYYQASRAFPGFPPILVDSRAFSVLNDPNPDAIPTLGWLGVAAVSALIVLVTQRSRERDRLREPSAR
jgi:hypothetical protein